MSLKAQRFVYWYVISLNPEKQFQALKQKNVQWRTQSTVMSYNAQQFVYVHTPSSVTMYMT
jgi:hypothetical protein